MADENKTTYIQSTAYANIGESAGQSATLEPGGRVLFNEDSDAHKSIRRAIEAGEPGYEHLSIVEVDRKAEAAADDERKEMLAKAEEIAAKQRLEQAQDAQKQLEDQQDAEAQRLEDGAPSAIAGTDFPPQDEEAQKLAEQSGAGQRATTQEDVVEEHGSKSGRRSARGKG